MSAAQILSGTPALVSASLIPGGGGGGGGVSSLTVGADALTGALTLSPGSGVSLATSSVPGPTPLNTITISAAGGSLAIATSGSAAIPTTSPYPIQSTAVGFGTPFTPAVTGYYVFQASYQPDVNPSVWGPGDILQIGIRENGSILTPTYLNFLGPSDPSAVQTIESQTYLVQLDAGAAYDFYWFAYNTSGTLQLGAGRCKAVIYS